MARHTELHQEDLDPEPIACEFWDIPTAALCGAAEAACEHAALWGVSSEQAVFEQDDESGEYWIVGSSLVQLADE